MAELARYDWLIDDAGLFLFGASARFAQRYPSDILPILPLSW